MAHEIEGDRNVAEHILNNLKPNATEEVDVAVIEEVVLVQKPIVEKPSILTRILIIIIALAVAVGIAYGISKTITKAKALKQITNNVQ